MSEAGPYSRFALPTLRYALLSLGVFIVVSGCSGSATSTVTSEALGTSTSAAVEPDALSYAETARFSNTNTVLRFGGAAGEAGRGKLIGRPSVLFEDDSWWTPQQSDSVPPPRIGHAIAFASSIDSVVVYGGGGSAQLLNCLQAPCPPGFLDDTWRLSDGTEVWQLVRTANSPGARSGHAMVYDPAQDVIVLFGGLGPGADGTSVSLLDDTWIYDPQQETWEEIDSDRSPSPRAFHRMVYDPGSRSVILWGGRTDDRDGDGSIWVLDTETYEWTEVETGSIAAPQPRWSYAMAREPQTGAIVMVGGTWFEDAQSVFGSDVWTLDTNEWSWTQQSDLGGPAAWASATALGDGRVLLYVFGSTGFYTPATDSWTWLPSRS